MATQLTADQVQALVDKAGSGLKRTWDVLANKLGAAMSPATQQVGNSLMTFLQSPVSNAGQWLVKASLFPGELAKAAQGELARGVQDDGTLAAIIQKAPAAAQQIRQMAQQAGGGPGTLVMLLGLAAIGAVGWWTYRSMSKSRKQLSGGRRIEEMDVEDEPEEADFGEGEDEPEEQLADFGGDGDADVDDPAQDFSDFDEDEPEEQLAGYQRSKRRRKRKSRIQRQTVVLG